MVIFWFLVYFGLLVGFTATQRKCSDFACSGSFASGAVFLLVNSIIGLSFFFLMAGGKIYVDSKILCFALIFALVCIGNNLGGLYALKHCLAASVTSVQSGGNMVIASTLGFVLWQEDATLPRILAIVLMLVALYCIFLETKKGQQGKGALGTQLLLLALVGIISAANTIVNKFFVELCGETHKNSYFFLTNVFMISYVLIFFGAYCLKHPFPADTLKNILKPKNLGLLVSNTVIGNAQSLVSVILLGLVDVAVYSTMLPSLGLLSGVAVSLLLRQKFTKFTYISVALAIAAVVLQAI